MEVIEKRHRRLITAAFENANEMGCGKLNRDDFIVACVELFGFRPSKHDLDKLFKEGKLDSQIYINMDEFTAFAAPRLQNPRQDDFLRQTFTMLDIECKNFLTVADFKRAMPASISQFPDRAIEEAFRETDTDGDGRASYRDFEQVLLFGLAK